jgi:hypothetical protein
MIELPIDRTWRLPAAVRPYLTPVLRRLVWLFPDPGAGDRAARLWVVHARVRRDRNGRGTVGRVGVGVGGARRCGRAR